jgi:iron complex outermembrane receptor protein
MGAAQAQVLEEVIVTAQKREQAIQDVGISVTAFTGEQIDRLGLLESTEVAALAPGVHVSAESAGQTRQFTIRGVTQNGFDGHLEAPNAVYIDEGYLATPQSQVFALFDLERVEILKGPQGTLFGRNATGGLVHYITRKPTETFEAFADVTYGSYNQVRVEGAVSGPLSPVLQGRVSGMYNRHDEIMDNHFPDQQTVIPGLGALAGSPTGAADVWDDDQYAVRGQLRWVPETDIEFLGSGYYAKQGGISSGPYQSAATTAVLNAAGNHVNTIFSADDPLNCEAIAETGGCFPGGIAALDGDFDDFRPVPGGDLFGYIDRDGGDFDTSTDHVAADFNFYESYGGTGKLSWDLGNMTLTAVSHGVIYDKRQTLDVDAAPVPQSVVMNVSDATTFTQEVRLNGELERARWVAGFYYLYIDSHYEIGLAFSPASPITLVLFGGLPIESDVLVDLETNSYSVFGQLDFDLTDTLTFIAGLRTIREEKDYDYNQAFFVNVDDALVDSNQAPFVLGIEYPAFTDSTNDTLWAGKLQFEYRPNDDWLIYAGVNRGVKAGSFNAKLHDFTAPPPTQEIPYSEEVLTAYEVGFKSTLFGGTTNLNGAFYFYDYADYQAFFFQQSSGLVRNNDAKFKGIEFDLTTSPIEGLDFLFNVSFIDAEVTNLQVAPGVFRDVTPSFTPSAQLAGLARYQWPNTLFGGGSFALQMDAYYASSNYHNIRNFQTHKMDARVVGNARVSWISADDRWEGTVFVDNLADARYKITGFDLPTLCGCNEEAYGRPRWAGFRLRYRWQ